MEDQAEPTRTALVTLDIDGASAAIRIPFVGNPTVADLLESMDRSFDALVHSGSGPVERTTADQFVVHRRSL